MTVWSFIFSGISLTIVLFCGCSGVFPGLLSTRNAAQRSDKSGSNLGKKRRQTTAYLQSARNNPPHKRGLFQGRAL